MPEAVIRNIGGALSVAQYSGKHPDAKPWKGLGSGVFEVVSDFPASFPGGLRRAARASHLCAALLSEEVAEWYSHGEHRCGTHRAASQGGAGPALRSPALSVDRR